MKMNQVADPSGGGGGAGAVVAPVAPAQAGSTLGTPPPAVVVAPEPGVTTVGQQAGIGDVKVTFPENWKHGLDASLRDDPSLGPVNDIPTLVKNYINAQKMIGKNKITVPDQHATDADWRNVFHKLGMPGKIEEYQFDVPKNASFDDGFLTEFKKVAYESNILPNQVQKLLGWYNDANNKALQGFDQKIQNQKQVALQELKQQWGEAYQQKVAMAHEAIKLSGLGDQIFSWLDQSMMGDDPNMIKLLAALGEKFKEDGLVGDGAPNTVTKSSLEGQLSEIMVNFEHPYYNKRHPNHEAAVRQVDQIHQLMHGSQSVNN
jgi:hypothetical protein